MEHTGKSEVAWLLEEIKLQHEAAQRGLTGLAQGTARHVFITARMESMGRIHEELQLLVGPEQALQLVAETLLANTGRKDNRETRLPPTTEKGQ